MTATRILSLLGVAVLVCMMGFSLAEQGDEYVLVDPSDFNIWDMEEQDPEVEARQLFNLLCQQYDLKHKNENIDCANVEFRSKDPLLDDNNHLIRKREVADDTELEGSGSEQPAESAVAPEIKEPIEAPQTDVKEQVASDNGTTLAPVVLLKPVEAAPDKAAEPANENQEKEEPPKTLAPVTVQPEIEPSKIPEPVVVPVANAESNNETEAKPVDIEKPSDKDTAAVPVEVDTVPGKPETTTSAPDPPKEDGAAAAVGSDKDSSEAATPKAEIETTLKPKETELIDEEQSGNAVLLKNPKVIVPLGVEGSDGDKHLAGLKTNAKVNVQSNEVVSPNTGESTKTVSRAGKDTTILVTLFVVVLVIGAAAFTHNFIKKRKQRAQNNDLVNGIRRSLQNLTSANGKSNSTDVEQGTEMKPLMKNASPTMVKEYTDKKASAEA